MTKIRLNGKILHLDCLKSYMFETILVCGGRFYDNEELVDTVLSSISPEIVIQGGMTGVDTLAKSWCLGNEVHCAEVEALWHVYGDPAGPKRNSMMLRLRPKLVVAFPGGSGTGGMVRQARFCNTHVAEICDE